MGEGTTSVSGSEQDATQPEASPKQTAEQLEAEIEALREELSPLVAEVDRRRHEFVDVRLQLRRHAWQIALGGAGVIAVAGGFVWFSVRRAHRRQTLMSRASRLREGVARMIDHPERVAAEPTLAGKILSAAVSAAVSATAKKAVERAVRTAFDWNSQPAASRRRSRADWPKAA